MRLISRIDVKNEHVIKGIHLEGLRKVGNPNDMARRYYHQGIDEIIFMDAVASLYDRNNLFHIIEEACVDVFVPITIGGGIKSESDIEAALRAGADKVAINSAAIRDPKLIARLANIYGNQCIVGSIEAKNNGHFWEAYMDNGREKSGLNVLDWVRQLEDLGVGEIFLTSVDQEGTKRGLDMKLIKAVCDLTTVPVIVCGGIGALSHIDPLAREGQVSALAVASLFHYDIETISDTKKYMRALDLETRQ